MTSAAGSSRASKEIVDGDDGATAELDRIAAATTRTVRTEGADEVWRCQATDALKATEPLKTSNLAQYPRELRNGNYTLSRFLFVAARGFVLEVISRLGKLKPLPLSGPGTRQEPVDLDIQPGDLVRVRERKQIAATLDEKGFNRGLSFDREELPYCGRTMRVIDRVDRIIDEKTGRMLKIRKDCLILKGAVCQGERTPGHWFCPRQIHAYWREGWVGAGGARRTQLSQSVRLRRARWRASEASVRALRTLSLIQKRARARRQRRRCSGVRSAITARALSSRCIR